METDSQLEASFWVMVVLQTIGSVDALPGSGARKLPAPGVYVPVIITWGVLQLVADAGFERGARIAGWVMLLTGAVIGPFGAKAVNIFKTVSTLYGVGPNQTTVAGGASTTVTPQNVQA